MLLEYEIGNVNNWTWTVRLFGEPLVLRRSNQNYYIHTDHLGRPELITNASKTIVCRANNYAFDRTVMQDSIGRQNTGYPGQSKDNETGLWHNFTATTMAGRQSRLRFLCLRGKLPAEPAPDLIRGLKGAVLSMRTRNGAPIRSFGPPSPAAQGKGSIAGCGIAHDPLRRGRIARLDPGPATAGR